VLDRYRPRHNSFIESIGVYLPSRIMSTQEVLAGCHSIPPGRRRAGHFERLTGIRNRRVASDGEGAIELAKQAMSKCFATSRHHPADVDLVISCSISRCSDHKSFIHEPSLAPVLSEHFECTRAVAFDVGNGCAGMFTAIKILDTLIKAGIIGVGMVVSGERISELMNTAQLEVTGYSDPRFACLTLGDAAVALMLSEAPDRGVGFHSIELYTAGRFSDYCTAKVTRQPHGGLIMSTRSAELIAQSSAFCPPDAVRVLERQGWGTGQLDHLILHQVAPVAFDIALREVNRLAGREVLQRRHVVNNLADRGNTASTSHFVAVWDGILNGRIASGDRALFSVQASGLTAGTAAYTFDDLPERVRRAERSTGAGRTLPTARKTGTARVRIHSVATVAHASGDTGLTRSCAAIERCLERSAYSKDDVDVLIHAGVYRDEFVGEPAIAAFAAGCADLNAAGMSASGKKTLAFDIWNGAVGALNGCYVGAGMIQSGQFKTVMVVASEVENNASVTGGELLGILEAGSAILLDASSDGATGFGGWLFERFPEYIGVFCSEAVYDSVPPRLRFQRRADIEALYLKCIPRTVHALLRQEGLTLDDIAVVLAPQLSESFTALLADVLSVANDRFVDVAAGEGDLFSSTLAHTFLNAGRGRRIRRGDVGLIINVGSGIQVGAATYHF